MVAAVILALATLGSSGTDSTNCNNTPAASQVEPSPTHILLQIVQVTPVASEALETMARAAAEIWAPYNIVVSPVYTKARPDDREGQWITLVFRDQPANRIDGKAPRGHRALASLVFTDGTPGDVIYASLGTALRTVQSGGLGKGASAVEERLAAQLLGLSVAHELGHYLLRSKNHSKEGLMRPSLDASDTISHDVARFRLLPEQIAALAGPPLYNPATSHAAGPHDPLAHTPRNPRRSVTRCTE
jgi:hypothetical protein